LPNPQGIELLRGQGDIDHLFRWGCDLRANFAPEHAQVDCGMLQQLACWTNPVRFSGCHVRQCGKDNKNCE